MKSEIYIDIIFGLSFILLLLLFYLYNIYKLSYWKRKNVFSPKAIPLFGNLIKEIFGIISIHEGFKELYLKWKKEPFIGLYKLSDPFLLINDYSIIEKILIKDFQFFPHRGIIVNEDVDPLVVNLLTLDGYRWKKLRHKITPLFTPGKLKKYIYHLLNDCSNLFDNYIEEIFIDGQSIDVRKISAKFTIDSISSCAFGINLNTFNNEDCEFQKIGFKVLDMNFSNVIKHYLQHILPSIFKLLKIRLISKKDTEFFMNRISDIVAYRKKNSIVRNDFIDLMTQLKNNPDEIDFELTDKLIAAQAFIFFLAGYETSSLTISYALYELALNQKIQDKLRFEIRESIEKNDGKFTYENIKELKYLDKVFKETLRKNPPIATLPREAVEDYIIPGTDVKIPTGMKVFISVLGLHNDPRYYPNPEIFDPERFSEEAIKQRPQMVYLPFGGGLRNCIGGRFAEYQVKMALIKILKNYRVKISSKTEIPYRISNYPFALMPLNGIYLNFEKQK